MKKIYILLTRSTTIVSKVVYFLTKDTYTHASMAFVEDLTPLYSSSRKNGVTMFPAGPCKEYLQRGIFKKHPEIPCALYVLTVDEKTYYRAKKEAEFIIGNGDSYHFNAFGLVLCRLGIALERKARFFCSQFVSEILRRSGAMEFTKETSLIRPSDYMSMDNLECLYEGDLGDLTKMIAEKG